MSLSKEFDLSAIAKPKSLSASHLRRQKFIAAIEKQLAAARVGDALPKASSWAWQSEAGEWFLSPRYGRAALELADGMATIKCGDAKGVVQSLQKLKSLAQDGQLDEVLEAAALAIRSRFAKA
ncbi:hypothetical protein GFB49_17495 [Epibacterium sp. SM1979]|uniref:Uncharacterized protein n=1 Tax=Tritonibacter litoralis TaxID=2662264 RepID=A0A843YKR9_9RHOB|nr:hypothetical protein [Tritonibacter litoralis]MQQ10265.1 hypothetical protein [Tritonibacter litoralis]